MERNLILAGVGGQGILTIAQAVSRSAMRRGWSVKQAEVHGMSQRGGAVYSHLRYADHPIHSDLIPRGECDLILAMEPLEALRYVEYLRPSGRIITSAAPVVNIPNYPPIEGVLDQVASCGDHVVVEGDRLAKAAGSGLAGNSVLLGAASADLGFESEELLDALTELFERKGARVVESNHRAFTLGRAAANAYSDALRHGATPKAARRWVASLTPDQLLDPTLRNTTDEVAFGASQTLSQIEYDAVAGVLEHAANQERVQLFEHEVYRIVELLGAIAAPRHVFVPRGEGISEEALVKFPGNRVVLKIVSRDITHKSDVGGVVFVDKSVDAVQQAMRGLVERHSASAANVEGVLVVEYVRPEERGFGGELFVGIRASREFGAVVAAGLGGVDTEYLAKKMRPGVAVAKALATDTSAEDFLDMFRQTAAYEVLSGQARGHRRVVDDGELLRCFRAFIALARSFAAESSDGVPRLTELEVNPFGFANHRMIPLDGRARMGTLPAPLVARPTDKISAMLEPRSIAVVGVSAKRVNFARIILNNTLECGFPRDHLYVLKDDMHILDGVRCIPRIADAPEPIDLLVVAAASEGIPQLVREAVENGSVSSIILIPGGLGETDGSKDLQAELRALVDESRLKPKGGPVVLGGNCLGVRSRPGKFDTFFVPSEKLDPHRSEPYSPTALITQSGAFAITRLSNWESINPALAITIGNQLDLTVADLVREVGRRSDIQVIGVYMEGFNTADGLSFVRAVEEVTAAGKLVIFYKAGRTAPGRSATAGHTASIAGDYDVCQSALAAAGAIVVDTVKEFEQLVEIGTLMRDKRVGGRRIGVISNAGFEAVGMADAIQGARYELEMPPLSPATSERIRAALERRKLTELINVRNPLDLNPMADEQVYLESAEAMLADPNLDAVVVSVVPFTPELATLPQEWSRDGSLVEQLPRLLRDAEKPLVMVIDAGPPYDQLARSLRKGGVPVFPACDQAIRSVGRYLCHRDSRRAPAEIAPRRFTGARPDLAMPVLTA